jgi:GNAT superfamily N-acetyltransferase
LSDRIRIRPAERNDVPLLLAMIGELAAYERAADRVTGTESLLESALFGPRPAAEAVIADIGAAPAGFALFFHTFSTWECRPGLYLEDLFVRPEHRGGGAGRALLSHLAALAVERSCPRFEWAALKWNTTAIRFYERLGAERLEEWDGFRLSGPALLAVARESERVT